MKLRNLTPDEIHLLEKQGCQADDWMNVEVKEAFVPNLIWHSTFEGNITLGVFEQLDDDVKQNVGIFHSRIIDCQIGDQVRIEHVKFLKNYDVGDNCFLEDIGSLSVDGETAFGNGTGIEVLNEAGGRTLPIYDKLNAQTAWLMVKCRHDTDAVSKLQKLIASYADSKKSRRGAIGSFTSIRHCSRIKNVTIGEGAQLINVNSLVEGTILSTQKAVTKIENSVTATNFIIQEGSSVTEGAILDNCFVGQSVKVGKQFSAENSAIFANSECFHGEACSIFAGPYTVTHHKSTLMIAGEYSFFNAGSGTNQSNHMYKLGPIHQGIVERGSKTGSFSYLLWPSKVGPYSVVMGKHGGNFDAGDFPFSYITEEHGKSILTPAMNLFTVGTKRDIQKWPARDKRKSVEKYDSITFDLYSPFIMNKVINAIDMLNDLYQNTPREQKMVLLNGAYISRLMLKTCRKYYELALKVFLGEEMILLLKDVSHISEFHKRAMTIGETGNGQWLDVAGLFMPYRELESLLQGLRNGDINSLPQLQELFIDRLNRYQENKTKVFKQIIKERRDIELSAITSEEVKKIIEDWQSASNKLNNMILKDAEKEFDITSHLGYGISSDEAIRDADFDQVHGRIEDNGFVSGLKEEMLSTNQKAEELIRLMSSS